MELTNEELLDEFKQAIEQDNFTGETRTEILRRMGQETQSYIGSDLEREQLERKALGDFAKPRLSGSGAAVSASPQPSGPLYWAIADKCARKVVTRILNDATFKKEGMLTPFFIGVKQDIQAACEEFRAKFFAAAPAQEPDSRLLEDCAMLLRRCVVKLKRGDESSNNFADTVNDFLGRKGLTGNLLREAAQEQPVENSPQISLKDFSVAKVLDGFSKEPPQPTVFSPATTQGTPDWGWFDREENAWCHKDRYTHWKVITPAPGSVPQAGPPK